MINKLLEYAKSINLDLEVFVIKNDEITIEYLNDKLSNYKLQNITEYKLKALIDNVAVTATVLDISNPQEVINLLKNARELTDELDSDSLALDIEIDEATREDIKINSNEIKENLKTINKELKEKYSEIFSIRSEFNFEHDKYEIYNTNGVKLQDFNHHGYYYSDIVLKIADENLSCGRFIMAKEPDFNKFKLTLEKVINDTIKKYNACSISTNKYNIVLDNRAVYDILKTFALDFHARNISKKQSVFTEKINKQIFSDKITIIEDPTNRNLIATRLFDDEGTKTYLKKVVECGEFKTILYDKKYAKKDNTTSTGNSYGVRNLYIVPGKKTQEELINSVKNGLFIEELLGLHAGINHLTGDISLQCEGFIIENGKKTKPLKQMVLSTNIFELFGNVLEIGNDLEFFGSNGGAPSLLLENITIAGKEV